MREGSDKGMTTSAASGRPAEKIMFTSAIWLDGGRGPAPTALRHQLQFVSTRSGIARFAMLRSKMTLKILILICCFLLSFSYFYEPS